MKFLEGNKMRGKLIIDQYTNTLNKWKRWRLRNLELSRERQRIYNHKLKENIKKELFTILGNKCNNCGFNDIRILQIDHVNSDGAKERKFLKCHSGSIEYFKMILEKVKQGSKDYQLLCPNCNWIKKVERNEI
jgi:hypothetical protein